MKTVKLILAGYFNAVVWVAMAAHPGPLLADISPQRGQPGSDGCFYAPVINPQFPVGARGYATAYKTRCIGIGPDRRYYFIDASTGIWLDDATGYKYRLVGGVWSVLTNQGWASVIQATAEVAPPLDSEDTPPEPMFFPDVPSQPARAPNLGNRSSPAPAAVLPSTAVSPAAPTASSAVSAPAPGSTNSGQSQPSQASPESLKRLMEFQDRHDEAMAKINAPPDCSKEPRLSQCVDLARQRHGFECWTERDRNTSYCRRQLEETARKRAALEDQQREHGQILRTNDRIADANAAAKGRELQAQADAAAARGREQRAQADAADARRREQQARADAADAQRQQQRALDDAAAARRADEARRNHW